MITPLIWDSDFFGLLVGRLCVDSSDTLYGALSESAQRAYDLVYVYMDSPIKVSLPDGYQLVDVGGHIEYSVDPLALYSKSHKSDLCVDEYIHQDGSPLFDLAYVSGHMSRFRVDPYIPNKYFYLLYEAWVNKLLSEKSTSRIYTCEINGNLCGMIAAQLNEKSCSIGLLSVLPAFQGRSLGKGLIQYLARICIDLGIEQIHVKTQLVNHGARNFYEANKFRETRQSFLWHAHSISGFLLGKTP